MVSGLIGRVPTRPFGVGVVVEGSGSFDGDLVYRRDVGSTTR
jgi:hypothetical protein